jgi:hypothetical protein
MKFTFGMSPVAKAATVAGSDGMAEAIPFQSHAVIGLCGKQPAKGYEDEM